MSRRSAIAKPTGTIAGSCRGDCRSATTGDKSSDGLEPIPTSRTASRRKTSCSRVNHLHRRKRGPSWWWRVTGSVVGEPKGAPRLWVAVVEDIAERKRLHDQLQRERDRLRLLLDLNTSFVSKLDLREFFDVLA